MYVNTQQDMGFAHDCPNFCIHPYMCRHKCSYKFWSCICTLSIYAFPHNVGILEFAGKSKSVCFINFSRAFFEKKMYSITTSTTSTDSAVSMWWWIPNTVCVCFVSLCGFNHNSALITYTHTHGAVMSHSSPLANRAHIYYRKLWKTA